MATSLEPLYEDLHLHPELSFGEHRTAGTVAERLRALGLEVLKGVGRTAAITMHGRGGHGSRPETTVDPMVMAAAAVMRLQTVVAREVAGGDSADLTVGQLHAGSKHNIISNEAVMGLSVRSSTGEVRERLMSGIERIIKAESAASGADREPEIVLQESLPGLVNDAAATARTRGAFHAAFTEQAAMDPGPVTGSEDVGIISGGADVPCATGSWAEPTRPRLRPRLRPAPLTGTSPPTTPRTSPRSSAPPWRRALPPWWLPPGSGSVSSLDLSVSSAVHC